MGNPTPDSLRLRALIDAHRPELNAALEKYHATNPRLFGSVARGDAGPESDIDILVDMDPSDGSIFSRACGLWGTIEQFFECKVDIFPPALLKRPISSQALDDAIPLWLELPASELATSLPRLRNANYFTITTDAIG